MTDFSPREIVSELDRFIVGQTDAKRAVSIALRNRWRRLPLTGSLREEVLPKNIIMIGPTGVGKTEIARRLANLVGAPFLKVEATKYTEVGYVGRDVESMVRDLVEASIRTVRAERIEQTRAAAEDAAIERLADAFEPSTRMPAAQTATPFSTLSAMLGNQGGARAVPEAPTATRTEEMETRRERVKQELRSGFYDVRIIEIDVEEPQTVLTFGGPRMEKMGGT